MKKIRVLYYHAIVISLLTSCSTKNFVYLHETEQNLKDTIQYHPTKTPYIIQAEDVLYITFHSVLSDAESFFKYSESKSEDRITQLSEGAMFINQYVVSDPGLIKIPVIGYVYVLGKTVPDIEKDIEAKAKLYVTDANVKVKLVNFKITFLGEFNSPGEKYFYRNNVNILDAIANAGDITYNGDRKNIRIIRKIPEGVESFRIDLSDNALLDSKEFYLNPNDIVYAEPLPRKIFNLRTSDYSILLVAISSTLALTSLIISVNK